MRERKGVKRGRKKKTRVEEQKGKEWLMVVLASTDTVSPQQIGSKATAD